MDGQTNGRYQTATDGLIGTEMNHELKDKKHKWISNKWMSEGWKEANCTK